MTLDTMTAKAIRAWGVDNGFPKARTGKLGSAVIDAYRACHVYPTGEPLAEWERELLDAQDVTEPVDDDGPGYSCVVNAWDTDHAGVIAQQVANLIGAVHTSTKDRILAALREQGTCRCITDAVDIIEAMS